MSAACVPMWITHQLNCFMRNVLCHLNMHKNLLAACELTSSVIYLDSTYFPFLCHIIFSSTEYFSRCAIDVIDNVCYLQVRIHGMFWLHYWVETWCRCGAIVHRLEGQCQCLLSAVCAASHQHQWPVICSSWHVSTNRTVCAKCIMCCNARTRMDCEFWCNAAKCF